MTAPLTFFDALALLLMGFGFSLSAAALGAALSLLRRPKEPTDEEIKRQVADAYVALRGPQTPTGSGRP